MKVLSSVIKLAPLLVASLLLAASGIEASENKDRRLDMIQISTSDNIVSNSRRRLHKSNAHTSTHTYWQGGYTKQTGKAAKKETKSRKSGKSKSAKSKSKKEVVYPWMGARPAKLTRKPTKKPSRRPSSKPPTKRPTDKPSSVTPPTLPPRDRFVEITMGGVLAVDNLKPIPPSGSDDIKDLALIFQETILNSLEDVYKCIVYEIDGNPVHVGGVRSYKNNQRLLQAESNVRFTLKVTKPCSGCDKSQAMILGSTVFDDTFQTLDASAESGLMTASFCSYAEDMGAIPTPCQVEITGAEGSSLDVKFILDSTTPQPTALERPTMPPVKWDPTPEPSLAPITASPTREGETVSPTDATDAPSTSAPIPIMTSSPTKLTSNPVTTTSSPTSPTMTPSPMMTPSTASPVDVPTTIAPTGTAAQPTSIPTAEPSTPIDTPAPTIALIPSTIAPTSTPPGSLYYTGFETGVFPGDIYWTTSDSAPWIIDAERVNSGVYSIRSPDLNSEDLTPQDSDVTFTTGDDFPPGDLVLFYLAGSRMPFDDLQYFVDGVYRGRLQSDGDEFSRISIPLGPGKHEVQFRYKFNPVGLPQFPPKGDFDHIGAVYFDDVYFLPTGVTMSPTTEKTSVKPTAPPTEPPTSVVTPPPSVVEPTYSPSDRPPTYAPTQSKPSSPSLFDGFESGDFSGENWSITGENAWVVDQDKPFEGSYSAHVRTEDIPESQLYSELNLPVTLDDPGFIQFYFFAPISQPFETLELWVDGQFLTPLTTEGGEWAQAGSILASGDHTVTWRYSKNPAGAPDEVLATWPQPDFRLGEAWLDNVKLLGSTASFTENWDSGDFSANPWVLSGDGKWVITGAESLEGSYSAAMATADFETTSGAADLSIDLITEKGGILTCNVLPSLQSTFDIFQILIDDIKIIEISEIQDEWQPQELTIQPGKRQVTFRLVKNPNNFDDAVLSSLPKDVQYQGRVWLDTIVFSANS